MNRLLVLLVPLAMTATGCAASVASTLASTQPEQHADREPPPAVSEPITADPVPVPDPKPDQPTAFRMWKFDAPIVPIRLDGSRLVPPADPTVLGWWGKRAGARTGTTLLTGHTVHTGGGELDDLELTPVGSTARVSEVTYRVVSVQVVSKAELARRSSKLFDQDGDPKLVIVTCEGYNHGTGDYDDNVVVVAKPQRHNLGSGSGR